jgi:hypothetical protein
MTDKTTSWKVATFLKITTGVAAEQGLTVVVDVTSLFATARCHCKGSARPFVLPLLASLWHPQPSHSILHWHLRLTSMEWDVQHHCSAKRRHCSGFCSILNQDLLQAHPLFPCLLQVLQRCRLIVASWRIDPQLDLQE